jgi:resuscitation-promoting factor RpfB
MTGYRYRSYRRRLTLQRMLRRLRWRLRRLGRQRDARLLAGAVACGLVLAILVRGGGARPAGSAPAQAAAAPVPTAAPAAPSSVAGNVALGEQLAGGYGWGSGSQWDCLYALWTRESGWSATAENPQSGAYGIAQALGHGPTNQYPAGPANPPVSSASAQITWGLGYIAGRYGSPCAAWAHEQADGWY